MHTVTAKLILSPLAEAITQLILIVSESENKKTHLPDLTALAKVVKEQITNLVTIGSKIGSQPNADDILRLKMPLACEEVTNASKLLVSGASLLLTDANSSEGRSMLLDAANGILMGTTSVLNTFDDFEIRKIQKAAIAVQNKTKIIENEASLTNTQSLLQTIMVTSQFIVTLSQMTNKRTSELLSLNHKNRLKAAVSSIARESPVLISALKVILQNPNNHACIGAKNMSCVRINEACIEISEVIMLRGESSGLKASQLSKNSFSIQLQLLDDARNRVSNNIVSRDGDAQELSNLTKDYDSNAGNFESYAKKLVGDMIKSRNTQDAQDLNNKLKVVSSHVAKANSVQSDLLDQVDDYDTKANTLTVLGNASRAYQQFGDDINNEIMADFIDTINAVSDSKASHTHFGIAYTSADLESATQSANATLKFGEKCNQLDTLLIHIANRVGIQNEKTAEDILLKKQKLRALLPGLISAIDIRAASNKDPASIGLLNTMVAMWESDVKDIRNLVLDAFDGVDIVTGTELAMSRITGSLLRIQDPVERKHALSCLEKLQAQYAQFLKKEIECSSDVGYKLILQSSVHRLETAVPHHLQQLKNILYIDEYDASEMTLGIKNLTDLLKSIASTINRPHQDVPRDDYLNLLPEPELAEPESAEVLVEDVIQVKVKELEITETIEEVEPEPKVKPVLFTAAEALINPIGAAAQEIIVEASKWSLKGNKIVEIVSLVAIAMNTLSEYHHALKTNQTSQNKAGFINASALILKYVLELQVLAKELVDKCTDVRLRKQLSDTLDQITTTAQQLKIVAAVKASAPNDNDRDQQLITCAQNLVRVVKSCMRECESVSIRQGAVSIDSSKPTKVMFRKQVYKKLNLQFA